MTSKNSERRLVLRKGLKGQESRRFTLALTSLGLIALVSETALAASVGSALDFSIHQTTLSTRVMGMGGAFVAVADDPSALFFNPAGLTQKLQSNISAEGLEVSIDSKFQKLVSDLEQASKDSNIQTMINLLESNYGNNYAARFSGLNLQFARSGGWGFAVVPMDLSMNLSINQLVGPSLSVIMRGDTTVAYGLGRKVNWLGSDHELSVGATIKLIHRVYANKALPATELALDSNVFKSEDANEGLTLDADVGALLKPKLPVPAWMEPRFGLAIRNVGAYGYLTNFHLIDKGSVKPPALERRIDLGTSFNLPEFWVFTSRVAADLRDMGAANWTLRKGSHLGAEFSWRMFRGWLGAWRVGLNQGYLTAGFSGRLAVFQLDLATYAEDVGTSDNPKPNRMYAVRMALDW